MKRNEIKKILSGHYSADSIKSIMCGRMKPSAKKRILFYKESNIPFLAWEDIKSFVTESVTQSKNNTKV